MLTSPAAEALAPAARRPRRSRPRAGVVVAIAVVLALVVVASLLLGVRSVSPDKVWAALWPGAAGHDLTDPDQRVVAQLRVPRTVLGVLAGLALGCVGTVIQGVTRNPIADPGLLGITPGASLAVVCAVSFLGVTSPLGFVWFAFAGAAAAAVIVFSIGRAQPVRLALVGAALTAFITPIVALVLLSDVNAFNQYRFWAVGSLTGRGLDTAAALWPFLVVGILLSALLARRLTLLAMGDDVAAALGQSVGVTRGLAAAAIVLLAGTATAFAGPIALVGLVVPHAARRLVGSDYRWIMPVAALLGPVVLLGADVIGRLIVPNSELEAGVVSAFIGAPVLVAVARGRSVAGV
ncbi:transport system permease protein [Xylanimonas cellulosilytica DSM 15894]|uniref:Transport system permease protein n=1 Tax=Xylanimonas cellulosilytica (strain DSM 15894 / JCM 12276 / CECT 5975 / KCTC 9989 / LMG 20990 / NBRC 107835 / XIL07) TaxID=446471 RepID=D1BUH7_XYLCX|nr:iron ABC transporter permease [Xylanimonas cellulosilytica]ACZ31190.1 transport system permease protein [Xylanimonas cellulosilytica DSM 15894]